MCGLTGIFGSAIDEESLEAFRASAVLSYLRGEHSTGVADYIYKDKDDQRKAFTMLKKVEKANDFFSPRSTYDIEVVNKRYYRTEKKNWKFQGPTAVMAHARAATIGGVKVENAHPFKCGNIIGMHNGTIRSHFEGRNKYETDSEAVFALMNELGEPEALQQITDLPIAAFALTWYNIKEETFNIYRNNERPLYFVKSLTDDEVFYSSDNLFLAAVLPYFGIHQKPEPIPVLTHFKFDLTAFNVFRSCKETKYKKSEVHGGYNQTFFPKDGRNGSSSNTGTGTNVPWGKSEHEILTYKPFHTKPSTITSSSYDPTAQVTRIRHESAFQISLDREIDVPSYNSMLGEGCSCCGMVPKDEEPVNMLQNGKDFICEDCIHDEMLVKYAILGCEAELNAKKEA